MLEFFLFSSGSVTLQQLQMLIYHAVVYRKNNYRLYGSEIIFIYYSPVTSSVQTHRLKDLRLNVSYSYMISLSSLLMKYCWFCSLHNSSTHFMRVSMAIYNRCLWNKYLCHLIIFSSRTSNFSRSWRRTSRLATVCMAVGFRQYVNATLKWDQYRSGLWVIEPGPSKPCCGRWYDHLAWLQPEKGLSSLVMTNISNINFLFSLRFLHNEWVGPCLFCLLVCLLFNVALCFYMTAIYK